MADTIDRVAALDPEQQETLVDTYWHALEVLHADGRDSVLEPLLDDAAAEHDVDQDAMALAAGRVGSGMRHYTHTHDDLAAALRDVRERADQLRDAAEEAAAAVDVMLETVLPAFMDEIEL